MTVPSFRQRIGRTEIQNKERELKSISQKNDKKEELISEEEHKKRIAILKEIGILKQNG